jgi:phosphatidate cytidylyltransferase
MKTRILLSLVMVPAFAFFIFFNNPLPFLILVTLLGILGVMEVYNMLEKKEMKAFKSSGLIFTALLFIFSIKNGIFNSPLIAYTLIFSFFVIMLFTMVILSRDVNNLPKIANTVFPVIYVAVLGSFCIHLRLLENGYYWIFLLFYLTFIYDGGAYFAGSFFGKNKLIPEISPGKSIEGCVGGVIINVIAVVIISFTFIPQGIMGRHTLLHLVILAILLSVSGQLGDLAASVIKRFCGVKNSSNLLPEMGGILDKIDSTLFNAPIMFLYIKFISVMF